MKQMFQFFCKQWHWWNSSTCVNKGIVACLSMADLVFSWGGGAVFQKNSKIWSTFFRSTKLIFRALPEHYKDLILNKNFAPQVFVQNKKNLILKKQVKKQFLSIFWKFLT